MEAVTAPVRFRVADTSQVGQARRLAAAAARAQGLDETRAGLAAIVATELASNLVKHAGGGELVIRPLPPAGASGIEILSLDKGPGIRDVGEALRDGCSTAGSPGTGLGAVQRLSSVFDLYSQPGLGAALLSQLWRQPPPGSAPDRRREVGAVCLPVAGERACGDAWAIHQSRERALVMVADGLGHGQDAANASAEALKVFAHHPASSPAEMLERVHAALRSTRGAAVAVAELLKDQHQLRYAGVGNISGRIFSAAGSRNMVSFNGTAGQEVRKIKEFTYPWPEDGLLVLHSDGLSGRWELGDWPGLRARHAALVAAVLFRDHCRARDDSTVVVVREAESSS